MLFCPQGNCLFSFMNCIITHEWDRVENRINDSNKQRNLNGNVLYYKTVLERVAG